MPNDEQKILQDFRQELTEDGILLEGDSMGTDDATLLRFLRARRFNIAAAKIMIINCQAWRRSVEGVGIDEMYRRFDPYDYPERTDTFKYWPLWFHKTDKQGRPLNIQSFGSIDVNALYGVISPEKHWESIVVNAESLVREVLPGASRARGKPVEQVFVIIDLKGFSIGQFWQMKGLSRRSFQISQDYYPETLGKLAIVNAPSSFTIVWNVMRPWLSKETVEKVDILGSDYKDFLLNLVDVENLPEMLGGKCACEGGCEMSNAGPWMEDRKKRREMWLRGELKNAGDPIPLDDPPVTKPAEETTIPNALHEKLPDSRPIDSTSAISSKDSVVSVQTDHKEGIADDPEIEGDENPLPALSKIVITD